jgi:CRISPR-associated endonuclease/helicase Cas3
MLSTSHFGAFHKAVHGGRQPFTWQQRLLEQIVRDRAWPTVLDLPTGSGKTTCIDIALFALAIDATSNCDERWCPRRIAMVVDRRIVVDQVAERGRVILRALMTSTDAIVIEVARRLCTLTRSGEEPLGVFTLRGGMPKDEGWARAPDKPLVIASTVDQVGSRLLMQGYGVSQGMKPVHGGLLANDTLLLLDEVHLSEPFRQTLDQLARLRSRFSGRSMKTRFAHVFLSATPGVSSPTRFSLLDDENTPTSQLGPRLHTPKPVHIVEVNDRIALEKTCIDQAIDLLTRHDTIAVVVNRLRSACEIADQLSETLGNEARITLLTGRMRPLDRDDLLRELRPAVQTGRDRNANNSKRVIVGTQCIEAGADFDFDALVTESASLDSLLQRFGRVDRLGEYGRAEGIIVHDKSAKEDPIYGKAIAKTIRWLNSEMERRKRALKSELAEEMKRRKTALAGLKGEDKKLAEENNRAYRKAKEDQLPFRVLDFAAFAIQPPEGDDLVGLLAPKPNAPTLLPAYLDLWAQTSPPPSQLPDVSLWLHGPRSGPAEVQVIWRADLTEEVLQRADIATAAAIVAAVRPSSLEAISLPFVVARNWLANQPTCCLGDTEGMTPGDIDVPTMPGRRAIRWKGDESEIICAQSGSEPSLKPGDTIVVPVSYGGIRCGCFDATSTAQVKDCAEQAEFFARARPVLRLHPAVIHAFGFTLPIDDAVESRRMLGQHASSNDWPAWKRLWAEKLAAGQGSLVVPGEPAWTVIEAKRVPLASLLNSLQPEDTFEYGVEVTTDGDDSFCVRRAVSLAEHCNDVETIAREFAQHCGLGEWLTEHIAIAAWLHDIGKADRRFQLLLRGGSEIELYKNEEPWAKSAMAPGDRAARQLARERSGYPSGGHFHALQSVGMLDGNEDVLAERLKRLDPEREPDLDLVLHLIASHHGECRPLAPVVIDHFPVNISLTGHSSAAFGNVDFVERQSNPMLHRLDSPLADRFSALIAKYGWQELCWLEAILRLADHCASEEEQWKEALH